MQPGGLVVLLVPYGCATQAGTNEHVPQTKIELRLFKQLHLIQLLESPHCPRKTEEIRAQRAWSEPSEKTSWDRADFSTREPRGAAKHPPGHCPARAGDSVGEQARRAPRACCCWEPPGHPCCPCVSWARRGVRDHPGWFLPFKPPLPSLAAFA